MVKDCSRTTTELRDALQKVTLPERPVRSVWGLKKHILKRAGQFGFTLFDTPLSGYAELRLRTRIKHALRYGHIPTTKTLVVSYTFVRSLCSVCRTWPELGEFFLDTALWHEYKHLHQHLASLEDLDTREAEANRFMVEKMGRPGLIVSIWYFSLHLDKRVRNSVLSDRGRRSPEQNRQKIIDCIQRFYPDLVPAQHYDKTADDVFWIEKNYQQQKIRCGPAARLRSHLDAFADIISKR